MEARLRAQCNPDLAEDVPSKLEQILKDRHNPDLSADEEAVRLTALLDGVADAEVRLDRLEAAKCQTCQRKPGVCSKPNKHVGGCTGPMCKKTYGCMKQYKHAGECKNTNSGVRPRCRTHGCMREMGHAGDCSIKCHTKGCFLKDGHDGECGKKPPYCKSHGCLKTLGHDGGCKISLSATPRCKKTPSCCLQPGHEAVCSTNLGTPGIKCSKVFRCFRWNGHGGNCTGSKSGPRCKNSKGCMSQPGHAGDCNVSVVVGPRCKKTKGCGRPVGHRGECIHSLGTPGLKCEMVIGCVRWGGHGGPHKKPKYETSTVGGSSLVDFKDFMDNLQDFPDCDF